MATWRGSLCYHGRWSTYWDGSVEVSGRLARGQTPWWLILQVLEQQIPSYTLIILLRPSIHIGSQLKACIHSFNEFIMKTTHPMIQSDSSLFWGAVCAESTTTLASGLNPVIGASVCEGKLQLCGFHDADHALYVCPRSHTLLNIGVPYTFETWQILL